MKILTPLDEKILCDIFDMDLMEGQDILNIKYGLGGTLQYSKIQALFNHICKLERLGYLKIEYNSEGKYYLNGGWKHPKYGNNVISIDTKRIHVSSDKGFQYVCDLRKTRCEKIKGYFKSLFTSLLAQLRNEIIKTVIAFIMGTLFGKYGIALISNVIKSLNK